jgi:hypothetical protein
MTTVIPLNPPPPLTYSIKASQYFIILLLNIISGIIVRILVFRKYYFMMDRDKIQSGYITVMEQDIMNTGYTYITVRSRLGRDRMGVRFTATYSICVYHH